MSNPLLDQLAQLGRVDAGELDGAAQEVAAADIGFEPQYAGYNDGRWLSAVLFNPSGREDQHVLVDGVGRATGLAARLPRVARIVEQLAAGFDLEVCWARLALMQPRSEVWEHRDFLELREQDKVRLHVPLITHRGARIHVPGASVHLAAGFVWHLATDRPHAASNDGPPRIHLIVDANDAARLAARAPERWLDASLVQHHRPLDPAIREEIAARFRRQLDGGDRAAAERGVLELFGRFDLGATTSYRLLSDLYRAAGDDVRAAHWRREETDKLIRRLA